MQEMTGRFKGFFALDIKQIIFWGLIIRIILIPFFSDNYNYWAAKTFTSFWLEGANPWTIVYIDPTLYHINPWRYPPTYMLFVALAQVTSAYFQNGIVFLYLIKIPLIIADAITTFFLFKMLVVLSNDTRKSAKLVTLYGLNPITMIISSVWGVMEPIPIMFTTLSLYYFIHASSNTELALSGNLLGWGAAFKLYPIFLIPPFVMKMKNIKKAIIFIASTVSPLVISSVPFLMWDFKSYTDIMLTHNVGGSNPLFLVFHTELNQLIQIVYILPIIALFIIAYFEKISLIANLVLSFLALYFAFGGNLATYSLWILPFAILLFSDKRVSLHKSSWILPFFPIPSIIYALIYNGQYNNVEGASGIYYWTYHWLRQKIVVFKSGPFLQTETFTQLSPIFLAINIGIILFLFYKIRKIARDTYPYEKNLENHSTSLSRHKSNRKLPLLLAITILVSSSLFFSRIVPIEFTEPAPEVSSNTFIFYDDFSSSLLNFQWYFIGNGSYTLQSNSSISYISINTTAASSNYAAIFRGREKTWNGFVNSSLATVELRCRFDDLADKSKGLTIAKTDGGWFGVRSEANSTNFIYFDDFMNNSKVVGAIDKKWHIIRIEYNENGRVIAFDNNTVGNYQTTKTFSFLFLGDPEIISHSKGVFSIDWVQVTIKDFPISSINEIYSALTLLAPFTLSLMISVYLYSRRIRGLKQPQAQRVTH